MASVRKRKLPSGEFRYLVDYRDQSGKRRAKQFERKKDADAYRDKIVGEIANRTHVHNRDAVTVERAYKDFTNSLIEDGKARSTIENYKVYYENHVRPYLGGALLPNIVPGDVQDFLDQLRRDGRTDDTIRRARTTLGAIFDEAIRKRQAHTNPVRQLRARRTARRAKIKANHRNRVRIPEREVVRKLLETAGRSDTTWMYARAPRTDGTWETLAVESVPAGPGSHRAFRAFRARYSTVKGAVVEMLTPAKWLRPMLAAMALGGLRVGEARGLTWPAVSADALEVETAVDRFNEHDAVKTEAAARRVPIGPYLGNTMRDWWRAQGQPKQGLVFPSEAGTPIKYNRVAYDYVAPLQIVLGILDGEGKPAWTPHDFRHFAVSLWIDQNASSKQVAEWVGHESAAFTEDTYWHLFETKRRDTSMVAAAEASVFGSSGDATRKQHDPSPNDKIVVFSKQ